MTRCNCESAYCTQHGGNMPAEARPGETGIVPTCDACPNEASPNIRMEFVGPICDACATVTENTGGASHIHRNTEEIS